MELTAEQIKRYSKRDIPWLRKKAGEHFRKWIRERDRGDACISCGASNPSDAGHYYSAGHNPELEFDEDNVHLQCRRCNWHEGSNAIEYRKGLIKKIGFVRVERLDYIVDFVKHTGYKHDRFRLIEIIEKYK